MILAAHHSREDFFSFYFAIRKIFTIFAAEIIKYRIMATTTKEQTVRPITKIWEIVKGLNDSEKLELMTMLIENFKSEVNKSKDPDMDDLEKDFYSPEEAYELVMKDVKSIYGVNDAV